MNIILSIHTKHAENIYSGKKIFELRTQMPKKLKIGETVWLYETSPVMRITGFFVFDGFISGCNASFISVIENGSCVKKEAIKSYYMHNLITGKTCHAMIVSCPKRLKIPIKPNWKRPPQNFCYGDAFNI